MTLSDTLYAIHGTNQLASIGKDLSHGCVRKEKGDLEELYDMAPAGTKVTIVSGAASPSGSASQPGQSTRKAESSPSNKSGQSSPSKPDLSNASPGESGAIGGLPDEIMRSGKRFSTTAMGKETNPLKTYKWLD